VKIFDELVDAANITDSSKLTRLLQFTTGAPHEAIKSCVYSKDGYASARAVLKERFGDKYLITDKIISGLRYGKPVRSPNELMQLADELHSCIKSLDDLGTKSEVGTQEFIVCVMKRLPEYVQTAWKRRAIGIKWQTENYPTFVDFADFIKEEAKIASDPVYGSVVHDQRPVVNHATSSFDDSASAGNPGDNATLSSDSNSGGRSESNISRWTCMLCNQPHKLFYCKRFRAMSVDERLNFVNLRKLCNVCFSEQHSTRACDSDYTCNVNGCNGRHSAFIHTDVPRGDSHALIANSVSSSIFIPIVEVSCNNTPVLAVLDSAFDASFCSRKFADSLGLSGKPTASSLSTLHGSRRLMTELVDIVISSNEIE
jgi:hypothetical protein